MISRSIACALEGNLRFAREMPRLEQKGRAQSLTSLTTAFHTYLWVALCRSRSPVIRAMPMIAADCVRIDGPEVVWDLLLERRR